MKKLFYYSNEKMFFVNLLNNNWNFLVFFLFHRSIFYGFAHRTNISNGSSMFSEMLKEKMLQTYLKFTYSLRNSSTSLICVLLCWWIKLFWYPCTIYDMHKQGKEEKFLLLLIIRLLITFLFHICSTYVRITFRGYRRRVYLPDSGP